MSLPFDFESGRRTDAWRGLGQHIAECFVNALSQDDTAEFGRWLKTKEGKEGFRELWPKIVYGYFLAPCNPTRP
jgi:hypothetical protein